VLVDAALADEVDKTLASLEDRRLWSGDICRRPPGRLGPPRQDLDRPEDQESWKITGPDQRTARVR